MEIRIILKCKERNKTSLIQTWNTSFAYSRNASWILTTKFYLSQNFSTLAERSEVNESVVLWILHWCLYRVCLVASSTRILLCWTKHRVSVWSLRTHRWRHKCALSFSPQNWEILMVTGTERLCWIQDQPLAIAHCGLGLQSQIRKNDQEFLCRG